jgi:hypothetical protein
MRTTIALATAFALSGTLAFAQQLSPNPTDPKQLPAPPPGAMMDNEVAPPGTVGMAPGARPLPAPDTRPMPGGDASNSGGETAAGPNNHGWQAEPGEVQRGVNGR